MILNYFDYLCDAKRNGTMILELNEVLLKDERQTLSMIAKSGELTCLSGGTPDQRRRWLYALMGFEIIQHGYISLDGEPLTEHSALAFRSMMAYAPARLSVMGEVTTYEPPTIQDVFNLQANREQPISNGILGEEVRKIGADASDQRSQLLAVAVLLDKPILLVDNPQEESAYYLVQQAQKGRLVIVTSTCPSIVDNANLVIEV